MISTEKKLLRNTMKELERKKKIKVSKNKS